ncbi:MAG TPA: NF038129 family PEP-CTERM protein [Candidatus Acidoferrum sp.]|jgi:hypothetical protein|nr:NF038129 family PEP-CTERM protein [Candidatus Acidoferrum sp.]
MKRVKRLLLQAFLLMLALVGLTCAASVALADSVRVTIGTAALLGTSGTLAFDFIDGDGVVNNTVSIANFISDATIGSGITTGSVSGSLPGTVTLSDASFFNELLVPATLGASISFTIDYTNAAGAPPDAFTFFLLDNTAINSLVTTDLSGNALLEIDMTGSSGGAVMLPGAISPAVTVSISSGPPPPPVPEPSSLLLMIAGMATLVSLSPRKWTNKSSAPNARRVA